MKTNPYQSPEYCDDNAQQLKVGRCLSFVETTATVGIVLFILSFVLATGMKLCTIGSDQFWSEAAAWSLIAAMNAILLEIAVECSK